MKTHTFPQIFFASAWETDAGFKWHNVNSRVRCQHSIIGDPNTCDPGLWYRSRGVCC
jgi:hypothetical protein